MIDIDNYDHDSKKATARRAARLAANEHHDRAGLIRLSEGLATAFTEVSLSARCGFSTEERARIRAALVAVNEHLMWAK